MCYQMGVIISCSVHLKARFSTRECNKRPFILLGKIGFGSFADQDMTVGLTGRLCLDFRYLHAAADQINSNEMFSYCGLNITSPCSPRASADAIVLFLALWELRSLSAPEFLGAVVKHLLQAVLYLL